MRCETGSFQAGRQRLTLMDLFLLWILITAVWWVIPNDLSAEVLVPTGGAQLRATQAVLCDRFATHLLMAQSDLSSTLSLVQLLVQIPDCQDSLHASASEVQL